MKPEILKNVDHTLLKQIATMKDIEKLCDDAIKCNNASACIPPCYVKQANQLKNFKIKAIFFQKFQNFQEKA